MDVVVSLVQVLLIASAGFFLWLAITDGRVSVASLRLRRRASIDLRGIAGAPHVLTPRTIRQTPLS
jgi:hypothetical protein